MQSATPDNRCEWKGRGIGTTDQHAGSYTGEAKGAKAFPEVECLGGKIVIGKIDSTVPCGSRGRLHYAAHRSYLGGYVQQTLLCTTVVRKQAVQRYDFSVLLRS